LHNARQTPQIFLQKEKGATMETNVITKEMLTWKFAEGFTVTNTQGIRERGDYKVVEKGGKKSKVYERPQIEMHVEYDYSGTSLEEVVAKSTETWAIKFATKARALGTDWMKTNAAKYVIKIATYFAGRVAAPKKSPKQTMIEYLGSLTVEQMIAFKENPQEFLTEPSAPKK